MIRHAKRNLGIFSSLFALIEGVILLLLNGILLLDRALGKLSEEAPNLASNLISFEMDPYTTKLSEEQPKFSIFYALLFVIGLLLLISAFKYFRKPIDKNGNITYKKGLLCFMIILSAAVLGIVFLGYSALPDFNFVDIDKMNVFCFVNIGLSLFSILLAVTTFFIKTNVYNLKTVVKPVNKQKVDVGTLYANEKLQKVQHLKNLGTMSEQDYKEASAKYSQGV